MKITVAIPAYNEEKNIAKIIVELKKVADEIIVCDDGSTDSTSVIAESLGAIVIKHSKNLGYGSAIRSIFLKSREINAELLVTIDADGQHNTEDIKKVIKPIVDGQSDISIGTSVILNPRLLDLIRISVDIPIPESDGVNDCRILLL